MIEKDDSIIEKLRTFLGDKRFRLMVGQARKRAGSKELPFWHYRALDEFEQQESIQLPRSPDALAEVLRDALPDPPELPAEQTPEWVHIDALGGQCPVQAEGWCFAGESKSVVWRFYFRAKHVAWSLSASDIWDPVDVFESGEHTYYYEEPYESRTDEYDAGYMRYDTARYYIVRELAKLRAQAASARTSLEGDLMSCVLRVNGTELDLDELLSKCEIDPVAVFRKGYPRSASKPTGSVHSVSGANFDVSRADFSELKLQISDALVFLKENESFVRRLRSFPGVEELCLDFGADIQPPGWCSFSFPPELLVAAGSQGVSLVLSVYPVSDADT